MLLAAASVLAGCLGGGGGDDGAEKVSGDQNRAPTISGSPPNEVLVDTPYSFVPSANDADSDELTFSVVNLPSWAGFDSTTGRISGTPSSEDVASYGNIQISVSDGEASVSLAAFSINVVATAPGSASLSWVPPTQNTDGTPLGNELAGFKIYWGPSEGNYTNSVTLDNPGLTAHTVTELTPGVWYFAATAYNSAGVESEHSNVASKQIM